MTQDTDTARQLAAQVAAYEQSVLAGDAVQAQAKGAALSASFSPAPAPGTPLAFVYAEFLRVDGQRLCTFAADAVAFKQALFAAEGKWQQAEQIFSVDRPGDLNWTRYTHASCLVASPYTNAEDLHRAVTVLADVLEWTNSAPSAQADRLELNGSCTVAVAYARLNDSDQADRALRYATRALRHLGSGDADSALLEATRTRVAALLASHPADLPGGPLELAPITDPLAAAGQAAVSAVSALSSPASSAPSVPAAPPLDAKDDLSQAVAELDALIGLTKAKQEVKELLSLIQIQARRAASGKTPVPVGRNLLLVGPRGTGKSTVAALIARSFRDLGLLATDKVVEVGKSELLSETAGQTAPKLTAAVQQALDGVLLIEDVDEILSHPACGELVSTLVGLCEQQASRVAVFLAADGDSLDAFLGKDPQLSRLFRRQIEFSSYRPEELVLLFERFATEADYTLAASVVPRLEELLDRLPDRHDKGFQNARSVRNIFEDTVARQAVRLSDLSEAADTSDAALSTLEGEDVFYSRYPDILALSTEEEIAAAFKELEELIGLEGVKQQFHSLANRLRVAIEREKQGLEEEDDFSHHLVFTGPPGTGKTTVARLVGRIYKALQILLTDKVVEVERPDLIAEFVGQTAPKVRSAVQRALDGILFIDEAYTLTQASGDGGQDFGPEAVGTLVKEMEDYRARLAVIAAGYTDEMRQFMEANPGLASRFSTTIEFPAYAASELTQMFLQLAQRNDFALTDAAKAELGKAMALVAASENSGNGRTVRNMFRDSITAQSNRLAKEKALDKQTLETLEAEDIQIPDFARENPLDLARPLLTSAAAGSDEQSEATTATASAQRV